MRRLTDSLSFRLALLYAGLFAGSLLLLLGSYYVVAIRLPMRHDERLVSREMESLARTYADEGAAGLERALAIRDRAHARPRPFHAFIDREGRIVTANLPSWPRHPAPGWRRMEADIFHDGDEIDMEALALDRRLPDGARLIVGRDIENITERERALGSTASLMVGMAALLGIAGGALLSRAIGRRIDAMSMTARQVMAGDLTRRVTVHGSGDDFDRLAETLNLMLDRIEGAMEAVRRVSDSVAHELRTPLARLRASLEDATTSLDRAGAARLGEVIVEAERIGAIFDAVLRISRIEAGRIEPCRDALAACRPIDLSLLLEDAIDYYRPGAEARGVALHAAVPPALMLAGEGDLIFQALANLLDNAIKYAAPGGTVSVSAQAGPDGAIAVTVADDGVGIAPAHIAHVTERFYRAPETSRMPGVGLGLSLVAAVAARHRATLALEDAAPGLRVILRFPPAGAA